MKYEITFARTGKVSVDADSETEAREAFTGNRVVQSIAQGILSQSDNLEIINITNHEDQAQKAFSCLLEALPKESENVHVFAYSGVILCDSEARANAIADMVDALYGDKVSVTGYYDPKEDKNGGTIDGATGWYYVDVI